MEKEGPVSTLHCLVTYSEATSPGAVGDHAGTPPFQGGLWTGGLWLTLLLLITGTRWGSDGGIILLDYGSIQGTWKIIRKRKGKRKGRRTEDREGSEGKKGGCQSHYYWILIMRT